MENIICWPDIPLNASYIWREVLRPLTWWWSWEILWNINKQVFGKMMLQTWDWVCILSVTGLPGDFTPNYGMRLWPFMIIRLQDCKCSSPVDEVRPISLLQFQRNPLQFFFGRGSLNGTHIAGIKQCSKCMVMFERFAFKMYCLAWFQKNMTPQAPQVIQFVTFSSPSWRSPFPTIERGYVFTIPKRSQSQTCQACFAGRKQRFFFSRKGGFGGHFSWEVSRSFTQQLWRRNWIYPP